MSKKIHATFIMGVTLTLMLCIVQFALTQPSSDNYILKKWAISSGGGSMSSDNYQAVAVIGQSSPPGTSTSTNYTLYSGFLGPIFGGAPGTAIVWVWTDSANVYLDWDDVPNVTSYNIYRASDPGVTATPGNLRGTSATSNYTDTNAVADGVKFFYLVTCSN